MARRRIKDQPGLAGDMAAQVEQYGKALAAQLPANATLDDIERLVLEQRFLIGEALLQHVTDNLSGESRVKKNAPSANANSKAKDGRAE